MAKIDFAILYDQVLKQFAMFQLIGDSVLQQLADALEICPDEVRIALISFGFAHYDDGDLVWAESLPEQQPEANEVVPQVSVTSLHPLAQAIRRQLDINPTGVMLIKAGTGQGKTFYIVEAEVDELLRELEEALQCKQDFPNEKMRVRIWITDLVDNTQSPYLLALRLLEQYQKENRLTEAEHRQIANVIRYAPARHVALTTQSDTDWKRLMVHLTPEQQELLNRLRRRAFSLARSVPGESPEARKSRNANLLEQTDRIYRQLRQHLRNALEHVVNTDPDVEDPYMDVEPALREAIFHLFPGDALAAGYGRLVFMTTHKFYLGVSGLFLSYKPVERTNQVLIIDESDRQHHTILSLMLRQKPIELLTLSRLICDALEDAHLPDTDWFKSLGDEWDELLEKAAWYRKEFHDKLLISLDTPSDFAEDRVSLFSNGITITLSTARRVVLLELDIAETCRRLKLVDNRDLIPSDTLATELFNAAFSLIRSLASFVESARRFYESNERRPRTDPLRKALALCNLHSQSDLFRYLSNEHLPIRHHSMGSPMYGDCCHEKGVDITVLMRISGHVCNLQQKRLHRSPSALLGAFAQVNQVVLISATVDHPSEINNLSIGYLKSRLGGDFYEFTKQELHDIHAHYLKLFDYQAAGVDCKAEFIGKLPSQEVELDNLYQQFYPGAPAGAAVTALLKNEDDSLNHQYDYEIWRTQRMLYVIQQFKSSDHDHRYGLALTMCDLGGRKHTARVDFYRKVAGDDVAILTVNAASFDNDRFFDERDAHLAAGRRVLVLANYAAVGAGKNLQRPVDEKDICHNFDPDRLGQPEIDFDLIFCERPTQLLAIDWPEGEEPGGQEGEPFGGDKATVKLQCLWALTAIWESGEIDNKTGRQAMEDLEATERPEDWENIVRSYYYKTFDFLVAVEAKLWQGIGRGSRAVCKRKRIRIYLDDGLIPVLKQVPRQQYPTREQMAVFKALDNITTKPILGINETKRSDNLNHLNMRASVRTLNRMLRHITLANKGSLDCEGQRRAVEAWQRLHSHVLRLPGSDSPDFVSAKQWIKLPADSDRFVFDYLGDDPQQAIRKRGNFGLFGTPPAYLNSGISHHTLVVSAENAGLPLINQNPLLSSRAKLAGIPLQWPHRRYHICPILYQAVYLAALGEWGISTLSQDYGLKVFSLVPPFFEHADMAMSVESTEGCTWVDAKHWCRDAHLTRRDDRAALAALSDRVEAAKATGHAVQRGALVNFIAHTDDEVRGYRFGDLAPMPLENADLITVPGLIDQHSGKTLNDNLDFLYEFVKR